MSASGAVTVLDVVTVLGLPPHEAPGCFAGSSSARDLKFTLFTVFFSLKVFFRTNDALHSLNAAVSTDSRGQRSVAEPHLTYRHGMCRVCGWFVLENSVVGRVWLVSRICFCTQGLYTIIIQRRSYLEETWNGLPRKGQECFWIWQFEKNDMDLQPRDNLRLMKK